METTERVVEAYVRYVRDWATIPNIKCDGQREIDLLAIDPVTLERYHIESGVSISGSFSKLTGKPFSPDELKQRVKQAGQRRTLGYFIEHKFEPPGVIARLGEYGFVPGNYTKVIVTWDWTPDVPPMASAAQIELWDFRKVMQEIADACETGRSYFTDDTLRILHLFCRASKELPISS